MGRRFAFSFASALLAGLLAGCAAPPVLTLASTVVTGASYLTTGKGPGDHLLSLVTGRECDAIRAFRDKPFSPICRRPAPRVARAAAQPAPAPDPGSALADTGGDQGDQGDLVALGRALATVAPAAGGAPSASVPPDPPPAAIAPALPDDVIAGLRAAVARNAEAAAGAALAARIADANKARIMAAERQRAGRALAAAVIAAIVRHPDRAGGIVNVAAAAAPESRAAIVAEARTAFPGFAAAIAEAANAPAPPAALAALLGPDRGPTTRPARARPGPWPRRPVAKAAPAASPPPA